MSARHDFAPGRSERLRAPPHSIDAEQAVLGALMLSPLAWPRISDMLTREDFYRHDHALIWSSVKALADAGKPFDAVTMGEWFEAQGMAEQVCNGAYLIELASTTSSAANIVAYAEIVKEKATLRKLIDVGMQAVNLGYQPDGRDTTEVIAEVQREIAGLAGSGKLTKARTLREIGVEWFDRLQEMYQAPELAHGLLTPWATLNALTNGFYDGDLIIGAGRPGMGKSAMAINVALSASMRGIRGGYFSLEMTGASIFNRGVAALSGIPLEWMRKPDPATEGDTYWARIADAVRGLRNAPMFIDETPGLTIDAIIARAKREHLLAPLRYVCIDHTHLISLPGKSNANKADELGDVSRKSKNLAKELGCPVILLSQLNRKVEERTNRRPMMSDLRESGALEQDADTIILFYRDDYYAAADGRVSPTPGVLEMIVAKQREGRTGTAYTKAELEYGRIGELPEGWTPPAVAAAGGTSESGGFRRKGRADG